jgi:hypothetical protein
MQAHRLRAEGHSFAAITRRLGVLEGSLRLWMEQFPDTPTIQPVEVMTSVVASGITLRAPDGFVFEGLDLDGAALLRGMLE